MQNDQTFIIKAPNLESILRSANKQELETLLTNPLSVLAGAISDYLEHGPMVFASPAVRVAHAALKGKLLQQVAHEINEFRKKGKIIDDVSKNKYGYETWVDLLKTIDEETPDEDRLEALKAMFYAANHVNATDAQQILAYQLFQIAKKLNSNDLLVLKAVDRARFQGGMASNSYNEWTARVSNAAGGLVSGLIELADDTLVRYSALPTALGTLW